jgi:hypothetical protein
MGSSRVRAACLAAIVASAGCGKQGTVTFVIEAPDPQTGQSPLGDSRRDSISLADEITGMPLGTSVTAHGPGALEAVGRIPIGTYDVRLSVTGGGQLLGLARARSVTIAPGADATVDLHLRKPIFYYGSNGSLFNPNTTQMDFPADALMSLDTTLAELAPIALPQVATAACSTHDGRYLLAAVGSEVRVVRTRDQVVGDQAVSVTDSGGGAAKILGMAASRDDTALAIITGEGLAVVSDLGAFTGGASSMVAAARLDRAPRRVAFSRDGQQIAVLTGEAWDAIDCMKAQTSSLYLFAAGDPGTVPAPMALPHAATDIVFTPESIPAPVPANAWVYAAPCGGGILGLDGQKVLAGDFYALGATADRLIAIPRTLVPKLVDVDPDDPTQHNVTIPFGEIRSAPGGDPTLFNVPSDSLALTTTGQSQLKIQVRLQPIEQIAYDLSVSPDGNHLVVLSRTHYAAQALDYVDVTDMCGDRIRCDVTAARDLYHVTEIDAVTGRIAYQRVTGVSDSKCSSVCSDCFVNICGENCPVLTPGNPRSCSTNFGFVPSRGSILMGGL